MVITLLVLLLTAAVVVWLTASAKPQPVRVRRDRPQAPLPAYDDRRGPGRT